VESYSNKNLRFGFPIEGAQSDNLGDYALLIHIKIDNGFILLYFYKGLGFWIILNDIPIPSLLLQLKNRTVL
jgi:hypothetical protein